MKENRIIHTEIGDLEVPRHKGRIRLRKGDDCGSNLMEGYNEEMGYDNGWLGQMFNGYESSGREPFTTEDVEAFIAECYNNPKMAEKYAPLLILIIGEDVQ